MSFRLKPWYFERDCPFCTRNGSSFCRNPLNFLAHAMWVKWSQKGLKIDDVALDIIFLRVSNAKTHKSEFYYKDSLRFVRSGTFQIYKSGNSLEKKVMTVKPVTSQSGIFGYKTFSSRVSLCAVTMDNLHRLTWCSGQHSLWREQFHETFHNLLTCLSCPPLPRCFFSLKELCGTLAHRMMYSLPYLFWLWFVVLFNFRVI